MPFLLVPCSRYSDCDRVQLMTAVMSELQKNGIRMPTPPPRKHMTIEEADKIARYA